MKRLQLHKLGYYLKYRWSRRSALRFWISDIRRAHERCAWCGWYLNPQLIFKGIARPAKLCNWQEDSGDFVCAACHQASERLAAEGVVE